MIFGTANKQSGEDLAVVANAEESDNIGTTSGLLSALGKNETSVNLTQSDINLMQQDEH